MHPTQHATFIAQMREQDASSIPASRVEFAAQTSNFAGMQFTKTQHCLSYDIYGLLKSLTQKLLACRSLVWHLWLCCVVCWHDHYTVLLSKYACCVTVQVAAVIPPLASLMP